MIIGSAGLTFDNVYNVAQQVALGVLGLGVVVATVRNKLKSNKQDDDAAKKKTDSVKLPGDALANIHPDPVVRRLERMLSGMGTQVDAQQKRLDAADRREGLMRQELEQLREEAQTNGDQVYWLRRIVRRLIDAWPNEHSSMPPLSQHEWAMVGTDEDTIPGRASDLGKPEPPLVEDMG